MPESSKISERILWGYHWERRDSFRTNQSFCFIPAIPWKSSISRPEPPKPEAKVFIFQRLPKEKLTPLSWSCLGTLLLDHRVRILQITLIWVCASRLPHQVLQFLIDLRFHLYWCKAILLWVRQILRTFSMTAGNLLADSPAWHVPYLAFLQRHHKFYSCS